MKEKETNHGMSRRRFMKNAAIGTGAVALTSLGASGAMALPPPLKWDRETDVIVSGAGAAGFCAAIEARKAGAKVILLEKEQIVGGSTALCGGQFSFAPTSMQKEQGILDSTDLFVRDLLKVGKGRSDPSLVRAFVDASNDAFEFLKSLGVKFANISIFAGMSVPRAHNANPAEVLKLLREEASRRGTEVMLRTPGKQLVADVKGRVLGMKVESRGKDIFIKAKRAVVLTTGGFGRNVDMLKEFGCLPLDLCIPVAALGITGDGHRMAMDVGGATKDIALGIGPGAGPSTPVDIETRMITMPNYQGAVMLNKAGKRFVNESISYNEIATAALSQPDALIIQIADAKIYAAAMKDPLSNKGTPKQADTLQAVASMAGLDPETVRATVDKYNLYVDQGKDPDFNRTTLVGISGRPVRIDSPPFYAFITKPAILSTKGGIRVNPQCQVIKIFGDPAPGLYAAGEIMGGFHGGGYMTGTAVGKAVVFGRIAGKNAASEKPAKS